MVWWPASTASARIWLINSRAEQAALGITAVPGTDQSRSIVSVPMMAGERIFGAVTLENHERDNAFGPADVRLLDDHRRQHGRGAAQRQELRGRAPARGRAGDRSTSMQQGLAGELDFRAIIDLVGDKLREVFAHPTRHPVVRRGKPT